MMHFHATEGFLKHILEVTKKSKNKEVVIKREGMLSTSKLQTKKEEKKNTCRLHETPELTDRSQELCICCKKKNLN